MKNLITNSARDLNYSNVTQDFYEAKKVNPRMIDYLLNNKPFFLNIIRPTESGIQLSAFDKQSLLNRSDESTIILQDIINNRISFIRINCKHERVDNYLFFVMVSNEQSLNFIHINNDLLKELIEAKYNGLKVVDKDIQYGLTIDEIVKYENQKDYEIHQVRNPQSNMSYAEFLQTRTVIPADILLFELEIENTIRQPLKS